MSASGMAMIDGLFFPFLLTILEFTTLDTPLLERVCGLLLKKDCCEFLGCWAASLLVSKLCLSWWESSLRNVVFFTVSQLDRFGVVFKLFTPLVSLFIERFVPLRLRTWRIRYGGVGAAIFWNESWPAAVSIVAWFLSFLLPALTATTYDGFSMSVILGAAA